jgi:hypothetical protein
MADERSLIPDLIQALDDSSDMVWQAAALSLRSMTHQKIGPHPGDDDKTLKKAKAEWEAWWKTQH